MTQVAETKEYASETIEPCPFCGEHLTFEKDDATGKSWWVHSGDEKEGDDRCIMTNYMVFARRYSLDRWNRRASDKPSEAVAVKPLKWIEHQRDEWHANSIVGQYSVGLIGERWTFILRRISGDNLYDERFTWLSSEAEAKAAAQADYEARILSTLTTQPAESAKSGDGLTVSLKAVQARLRKMADDLQRNNTADNERSAAFHMSSALRTAAIHLGNESAALGDHRNV